MARKPADQAVSRPDILFAAGHVFRRQGYHGAKMADIAAEVDLTAGSLYHHFPGGKQQILIEVLNAGLELITDSTREIVEDDSLSPDEKIKRMVHCHVETLTENMAVAAAFVFETRTLLENPAERASYLQRRDAFESLYDRVIKEGIRSGLFRQVDVPIFTKTMLGAQNWVGLWYRKDGRLSGKEIAEEMGRNFLVALKA